MKHIILLSIILLFVGKVPAQTLIPAIVFKENPLTHNMHLTSDGEFLYTCNGGKSDSGQIAKYNLDGIKMDSYKIELDMRSIMYNSADKKLYVYTYNQKLYRINDLVQGNYSEVFTFPDRHEQSTPALSVNGKLIYFLEYGKLYIYRMRKGRMKSTLLGFNTADNIAQGGTAVAVDKQHIYSWNADKRIVYIYNLRGKFQKSIQLSQGDYGFSLSYANGMLWVSTDGDYDEGTWYGYAVK